MNPWWKRTDDVDDPQEQSQPESNSEASDKSSEPAVESSVAESASESDQGDSPAAEKTKAATAEDSAADDAAAAKPKRVRRTRRAPSKAAASSAEADAESESAAADADDNEAGEEATKPRPRRRAPRRRSTTSEAATASEVAETEESAAAADDTEPAKRRPSRRRSSRGRKTADSAPAARSTPSEPPLAPAPPPPAATAPAPFLATDLLDLMRDSMSSPDQTTEESKIAVFFDFENIALGIKESEVPTLDVNLVLERLLEKGKIIVKRAYADWERYSEYKKTLHSLAIELIDIPQRYYSGKNSADIRLVVDVMDIAASKEHLDTFVVISGDSDFSPLVSKLKENDKHVIGVGVKNSSSKLLIDNCDEFIFYEDIWRDNQSATKVEDPDKKASEVFSLMTEAIQALRRENKPVLWGSMIKQTMQRKSPSFNEGYFGYGSFSELLEEAEKRGLITLKKDGRSGSYIITSLGRS